MSEDIETRILAEFERRLEREGDVSPGTKAVLLERTDGTDFGDDEDVLAAVVESL